VVSETLVIIYWENARSGTVINLLIFVVVVFLAAVAAKVLVSAAEGMYRKENWSVSVTGYKSFNGVTIGYRRCWGGNIILFHEEVPLTALAGVPCCWATKHIAEIHCKNTSPYPLSPNISSSG
jgi:hypothetical protein